ncbi:MAG: SCO family protein, partial [Candidatus Thiodiazotropha sp.]
MNELNLPTTRSAGKGALIFIVIVAALAGTVLSWYLFKPGYSGTAQIATKQATVLPATKPIAPFVLTDQHGKRFDNQRLLGKWTLLSFGYTNCPDICPTDLAMLAQVDDQLSQDSNMPPYQIGFVSIRSATRPQSWPSTSPTSTPRFSALPAARQHCSRLPARSVSSM